jgi:beta-glucosidase
LFLRFPEGFLWGSGTSAHQVEGGNRNNDWWAFEHAGHIRDGEVSGEACDQWHRFREDLRLAADLGHQAHKISVEWSRIEKEPGVFDEDALAHYAEVLHTMRDLGIKSFVTLHHFTSPLWLEAIGCWESAEAVQRFASFSKVVAERLGDLVDAWITVNEPMLLAAFGYVEGYWPPRRKSLGAGLRAARNLAAAHNAAYDAVKSVRPDAVVGVAVNSTVFELSAQHALWERFFVTPADWFGNRWYLDRCRGRLDFVGLQYYSRTTIRQLLFGDPTAGPLSGDELPVTDLGWAIYPEGMRKVVKQAWRRYKVPLYITENGLADAEDVIRKVFIHDHLKCLHAAIEEGADVRGYFHWSLIDNFEWREGFWPRFGLVAVDYATQERTVRDSARYYAMICRENGLEVADPSVQHLP